MRNLQAAGLVAALMAPSIGGDVEIEHSRPGRGKVERPPPRPRKPKVSKAARRIARRRR